MGRLLPGSACLAALVVACGSGQSSGHGSDAAVDQTADATGDGGSGDASDSSMATDTGLATGDDSGIDAAMETGGDDGGGDDGDGGSLVCSGDMYEPNDTEVTAYPLGSIDECDTSGSTLTAVSSGTGDVDWYEYSGTSTLTCTADPTATIDAAGLEVCIFVICAEGTTTIASCTNGSPSMSAAGTPGCCTTSTTSMTAQMACSSTTNAANVYMRVQQPSSNMCVPYDLAYHF
jgi:hypothetical protein